MFPFLSNHARKDKTVARACICLFALLFFLCSLVSSLPSLDRIGDRLARYTPAGYAEASDERSDHARALEQFTDRPFSEGTGTSDEPSGVRTPEAPPVTAPPTDEDAVSFDLSSL